MNPDMRAKPKRATTTTRPKNQSAFQNAVFMNSPLSSPRAPSYMGGATESPSQVELRSHAARPGEPGELGGDDQVLDRHALRLEERSLFGRGPSGPDAGDHLAQLGQRARVQAAFLERRQQVAGFLERR